MPRKYESRVRAVTGQTSPRQNPRSKPPPQKPLKDKTPDENLPG